MKKQFAFLLSLCVSISIAEAQSNKIGSGIALKFDGGVGNYVDLGDVFNTLDFPFTIEAWINPASNPVQQDGIFSSENDASAYNGAWLYRWYYTYSSPDVLRIEFGNGQGSGYQFRRGFLTTESLPLNIWTHIAVVCNSITDIHMYFNGVEKTLIATDGTSTATVITHTSTSAGIGRYLNYFGDHYLDGQLDEVRLWDVARTQTEIRDNMCRKIDPATSGLIGYWIADESYISSTVIDQTVPSENGVVNGTVAKITSGAPIGDASAYSYTSNWNGVTVSVSESSGDSFIASNVIGSPYGVHVYLVDSLPHDTIGLDTVPKFYFGVFCAESASTAGYDVKYNYDFNDGAINAGNESTAALYRRDDGSVTTWNNIAATLDMISDNISKSNETIRDEYILNVKGFLSISFSAADTSICEKYCIDFFDQSTNNPTSWQWIFSGGNPSTSNQQNPAQICYNLPGVYDVTLITSGANGIDTLTLHNYITVLATPSAPTITQIGFTLTSSYSSSYQWQLNAVDIPGATDQSYTVLQSGYYTVIISNENGCKNSFTVYVLISGTDEIVIESTSVFPNPADNQINIDLSKIRVPISYLRISDDAGRVLIERKVVRRTPYGENKNQQVNVDVSGFAPGIYFIEAISVSQKFYGKFTVQK
ncbi:MAG TPA: LamG-like jellyroll fold domain-containing protein [Chitinophagales bacterium]|nr:LamG-like jellyroll fold domain-containing protein [Chitinophagales bacterium]